MYCLVKKTDESSTSFKKSYSKKLTSSIYFRNSLNLSQKPKLIFSKFAAIK